MPPLRLYLFVSFIYFLLASVIANFTPPTEIAINSQDTEDAAPIVLNLEGDSNLFNRKLDSLLSLNMDSVPDDDYMDARLGKGTAKLVSIQPQQRDDLVRSTTPFVL